LISTARNRPRPFNRFRIGLVKAPLPGPSSTTISPGLMSQQSMITRDSALELGQTAPVLIGSRTKARIKLNAEITGEASPRLGSADDSM
jgi:hypothetical protein